MGITPLHFSNINEKKHTAYLTTQPTCILKITARECDSLKRASPSLLTDSTRSEEQNTAAIHVTIITYETINLGWMIGLVMLETE
jgi:hypothetical protein